MLKCHFDYEPPLCLTSKITSRIEASVWFRLGCILCQSNVAIQPLISFRSTNPFYFTSEQASVPEHLLSRAQDFHNPLFSSISPPNSKGRLSFPYQTSELGCPICSPNRSLLREDLWQLNLSFALSPLPVSDVPTWFLLFPLKGCCWTTKDAGILGLWRRRIQSGTKAKVWSVRAFV